MKDREKGFLCYKYSVFMPGKTPSLLNRCCKNPERKPNPYN